VPLPTPNKCAVCVAKVLENYFLKTTLEPEGINEDVPAISFCGLNASASPIINSNGLYMSYAATPHVLHPAEPIYSVHRRKTQTECEFVAFPQVLTFKAGYSCESQTEF